jgi:hypothetical protein
MDVARAVLISALAAVLVACSFSVRRYGRGLYLCLPAMAMALD